MTTSQLCFLPLNTAVQLMILIRMFLAKLAVFWVFFSSPTALLTGLLGGLVRSLLPDTPGPTLAIPCLAAELVVNTLALVGIWRSTRLCLIPWLMFNLCLIFAIGAGVVGLLIPVLLPVLLLEDHQDLGDDCINKLQEIPTDVQCPPCGLDCQGAIKDISRYMMVIILNMILVAEMFNASAVLRVFVDMRQERQRTVSFSSKPEVKVLDNDILTGVRMYEEPPVRNETRPTSMTSLLTDNPNITISLEDDVNGPRNSWDNLKFTFNNENFE